MNENRRGHGVSLGRGREWGEYSAKRETPGEGMIEKINKRNRDERLRECLSGTYVGSPGADPHGRISDIRHRKPREIVPQVSADASIKTR